MNTILLIEGAAVLAVGVLLGYIIRHYVAIARRGSIEADIEEKLLQAKRDARQIEEEALLKASSFRDEMKKIEERIVKQEERLDKREQELQSKETDLSVDIASLKEKGKKLEELHNKVEERDRAISKELEKVASLTEEDARVMLLRKI